MRGLYIHIPFCAGLCPYCNFYSEKNNDISVQEKYIDALLLEISAINNKVFDTVYIGGGTPSFLPFNLLDKLLNKTLSLIDYKGVEWTVEANPESVEDDFLSVIKSYPVSRLSLGVQSFDDEILKLLGRIHSSKRAETAAEKILSTGRQLNMDMIYDIPYTDNKKSIETLKKIISINPHHISAYSYDSSDTGYLKEGVDEDNTLFEEVEKICAEYGYLKYETSNFAKEGFHSRHNCLYWQGEEYTGIGAAAHSMVLLEENKRKRYNHKENIKEYIENPYFIDNIEIISAEDALMEDIIFGLRMKKGINLETLQKKFGKFNKSLLNKINSNIANGLLEKDGIWLKATIKGSLMLESLSCSLLP